MEYVTTNLLIFPVLVADKKASEDISFKYLRTDMNLIMDLIFLGFMSIF